jgi:hypothetical protein
MAFDAASPALAPPPADPAGPHAATSCFDLLLVELVPMAYRLAAEVEGRALTAGQQGGSAAAAAAAAATTAAAGAADAKSGLGVGGIGGAVAGMDEEETREVVFWRLDAVGYRVGLGIVDKSVGSVVQGVVGLIGGQVCARQAEIHGHAGRDQIHLQGHLDHGVQEADRQPQDQPSRALPVYRDVVLTKFRASTCSQTTPSSRSAASASSADERA